MPSRVCHVCGKRFSDSIPQYPNPESICDDCYSDRLRIARARRMAELDIDGRCAYCGADIQGSVAAHELYCSFARKGEMLIIQEVER